MPGLVQEQLDLTRDEDVTAPGRIREVTPTSYEAPTREVTRDETVLGQLDRVLADDSPLIQRARARATEYANQRGLVNSTMAAQAGEAAAIDASLPVASADASTYGRVASDNQALTASARQFGATAANQAGTINATAANEYGATRQKGEIEAGLVKLRGEVDTGLQTLRGNQAKDLALIEANYKQLMQANASAASLFNESMAQIATVLRDPSTSSEQKQSAVDAINSMLESSLAVAGAISNMNFGALLNFKYSVPAAPVNAGGNNSTNNTAGAGNDYGSGDSAGPADGGGSADAGAV